MNFKRISGHLNPAGRIACTAGLSLALVLGSSFGPLTSAYAMSAETQSQLSQLTSQVDSATSTYTAAKAKAAELDAQVQELADEVLRMEQEELPAQRERASQAVSNLYKTQQNPANVIGTLLGAESFEDIIDLAKYLGVIQDKNVSALQDLEKLHDQLQEKIKQASESKDQADAQEQAAANALAQAQSAQQKIQDKANAEDAAEAEAARAAAEAAAAKVQAAQQASGSSSDNTASGNSGSTNSSTSASTGSSSSTGSSAGGSSSQPSTNTGSNSGSSNSGNNSNSSQSGGAWLSGVASYYGIGDGFMGGTTASGAKVTETSMGVAMLNVPLGTYVEISYGGKSVIAVVNDRGPYAHGRVIDMQPAVARALGFVSVGVGTVKYRFL